MNVQSALAIFLCIALSACIPPKPTPATSPISPMATFAPAAFKTPTPKPILDGGAIWNSSFEQPYTCPENAVCIPQGWNYWRVAVPPCRPGRPGCNLPCPTTCLKDNGACQADNGCYWASPEIGEATLQWYYRVHTGSSALKMFSSGRMWEAGVWQQVYHVPLGAELHFSAWAEAWQCYQYANCNYGELSDQPASMNIRVGIDPFGGTDPYTTTVVWSSAGESFDHFAKFSVTATARYQVVTVFVMGAPRWDWPRSNGNDLYIDDARLEVLPVPITATVTPTGEPTTMPVPFTPSDYVYLPVVLNGE